MNELVARPAVQTSRRDLLVGGLTALTAAVAFSRMPHNHVIALPGPDIDGAFATNVGRWHMTPDANFVMPPADEQKAAAVYEDQVVRSYADGSDSPVMFLLAYARQQSGMLMVHRPESCYPGAGFTITATRAVSLALAPGLNVRAQFLSTQRDTRVEQVLYWTRLGNSFPRTWHDERWSLAMQSLAGKIPDGALVRMSVIDPDPEAALANLKTFAQTLFVTSGRDGKALLGGPGNV